LKYTVKSSALHADRRQVPLCKNNSEEKHAKPFSVSTETKTNVLNSMIPTDLNICLL